MPQPRASSHHFKPNTQQSEILESIFDMPSTPEFEEPGEERFDSNLQDDHPVASEAGPGEPEGIEASQSLVEDARAVWNGDADHLLVDTELLADVEGTHGIGQDIANAGVSYALDINVAPQTDSGNTIPYGSLPQIRIQAPVAPVIPPVNNQVQHASVTASRQCPYGCPSTFGRPGEYRRHMKKHNGPFFPCTVLHCSKVFYRQDKLNDHLNNGH